MLRYLRDDACREVVLDGRTGYTFPSGDVGALADAIAKIATAPPAEQEKLAMGGKEMVFAEHDKKKQFEKILTIIQEKAAIAFKSSSPAAAALL